MPSLRLPIKCLAAAAPLALAACGASHGYPSLAQRPVERTVLAVPPAPEPPPVIDPLPADLPGKVAALLASVAASHARFSALDTAAGGPRDIRLSQLEAARAETSAAVARIERLMVDDRVAHAVADGMAGEGAEPRPAAALLARARVTGLDYLAREDAALARRSAPIN